MIEIGKKYIFFYRSDDSIYGDDDSKQLLSYSGMMPCTVFSDESAKVPSSDLHGGLFAIRFDDGEEFSVYGEELVPIDMCIKGKLGNYWPKIQPDISSNLEYHAQLYYGWADTGYDDSHSFQLSDQLIDSDQAKQHLMEMLDADENAFNWDIAELTIPQNIVKKIKADAIAEYLNSQSE